MKKAFRKNIYRTILKSMGRFMAIFAIIALGVGFFSGLKSSKPAMMKTAREYIKNDRLFDFRLLSTWGFEASEVERIKEVSGAEEAEGAVSEDFIYVNEQGAESVLKAHSITEDVNRLKVVSGSLPAQADECVLDAYYFQEDMIGKEIRLSDKNSKDTKKSFAYDTYRVTGLVRSPIYMNMERGTTNIGSGKISGFVFMPLESFTFDYLEEIYISFKNDAEAFTDEYADFLNDNTDPIEEETTAVVEERYQKEIQDANAEISDAEQELDEKSRDAAKELEDAKKELEEGAQKIADGKEELEEAKRTLAQSEQELEDGEAALQGAVSQYESGMAEYEAGYAQYETGLAGLEQNQGANEAAKQELETVRAGLEEAKAQLDASSVQIEENRQKLSEGRTELENGKQKVRESEAEIVQKEQELSDGWKEYEDGQADLERETKEAEEKIADAKEELSGIEEPKVYALDRNTNAGYALFESDVSIVEGVAKIFPLFFFLIAALVCSTTMTRMVDDERTQIGTLRALGYTRGAIFTKYMIYAASAAGLGAVTGFFVGIWIFPKTIWTAYGMLYGFSDIVYVADYLLLFLSLAVAFLCSAGTTYAACRLELSHTPADLIRPKAPSPGKRILLERVPFIWKKLKFLHKVSARNVFRFKKRMIMMILGIAGCMALVVTGYGVKDSISNIADNQYDRIFQYDISAAFSKKVTEKSFQKIEDKFGPEIDSKAVLMQTAVDAPYAGGSKSVTLLAADGKELENCVNLQRNGSKVKSPAKGEVVIDQRLARALDLGIGDEISFQVGDDKKKPLTVSGIFENYINYYAYVNGETYEEYFSEQYEPNTIFLSLKEGTDEYQIASYLGDMKNVSSVSVTSDLRSRVGNMMSSLDYVVMLVIGCAGALAFIVLFNLGNINISERVREIATLKVLGFYPRETGSYVFRENMVLSMIGMVCGIPLGILLHRFVMLQIQIDMVSFDIYILPLSFLYSILTVLGFTVVVDLIMRRKIDKINMAESLKSIE